MKKAEKITFNKIFELIKKYKIVIAIVFIVLIILFISLRNNTVKLKESNIVEQKDVLKTVLASGNIISETDLNLSFQASNIVHNITVKVGDEVKKDQVIASLMNDSQIADLARAKGQLLSAKAKYRKVVEGASNTDINAASDALDNSVRTQNRLVDNAKRTLLSDGLIAKPTRTDMQQANAPIISGLYQGNDDTNYNLFVGQSNKTLSFTGPEKGEISVLNLQQSFGTKGLLVTFPVDSYSYNDEWNIEIPNKSGKNYTLNLNAYNAALANREEIIASAKSKLKVVSSASRQADIDAARADVIIAEAGVASAQATVEKTLIRTPAKGTITKISIKVGDLATANVPVITLQDVSNLYVESNINEENINGVKEGQQVDITLDALDKTDIRKGKISLVDLGPTTNGGVVNYRIRALISDVTNIRAGMTADLQIVTASSTNAITIPSRFIFSEGDTSYVWKIADPKTKKLVKTIITKGIRTDGAMFVVLSGLNKGEEIAIPETAN